MWLLASAQTQTEFTVRDQLAEVRIVTYVPIWRRLIKPRHCRRPRISERPLFDRVVLLQSDDIGRDRTIIRNRTAARLWFASYTDVVLKERRYVMVRDSEVERLRARVDSGEFDMLTKTVPARYRIGDDVRFTAGALVDRTGVVAAQVNGAKFRIDVGALSVLVGADQIALAGEERGCPHMSDMGTLPGVVLDRLAELAGPLHPTDISAAIALLKQEPDPGLGTVDRVARSLLALGTYRRDVVAGAGRPRAGAHAGTDHAGRRGRHGKLPPADDDAA
jgi:hypothetical protein